MELHKLHFLGECRWPSGLLTLDFESELEIAQHYQYHQPCTVSTLPLILFDMILAQTRDVTRASAGVRIEGGLYNQSLHRVSQYYQTNAEWYVSLQITINQLSFMLTVQSKQNRVLFGAPTLVHWWHNQFISKRTIEFFSARMKYEIEIRKNSHSDNGKSPTNVHANQTEWPSNHRGIEKRVVHALRAYGSDIRKFHGHGTNDRHKKNKGFGLSDQEPQWNLD
ncbi:hypothetical protein J6590_035570 [Homalodisca vitripennis]|nr:hypothetical protein J6590_035570 [Homalodisca vitripennis]